MSAVTAAQPQEAVGQDAARKKSVELVLDELRQVGAGLGTELTCCDRGDPLARPAEIEPATPAFGGLNWVGTAMNSDDRLASAVNGIFLSPLRVLSIIAAIHVWYPLTFLI